MTEYENFLENLTLQELLQNYSIELMSGEPGHEWYKLSFAIPVNTEEDARKLVNRLREQALERFSFPTTIELPKGVTADMFQELIWSMQNLTEKKKGKAA